MAILLLTAPLALYEELRWRLRDDEEIARRLGLSTENLTNELKQWRRKKTISRDVFARLETIARELAADDEVVRTRAMALDMIERATRVLRSAETAAEPPGTRRAARDRRPRDGATEQAAP